MSEEAEVVRQFGIMAYDPTKPIPGRRRQYIMDTIYTKDELEKKLEQYSQVSRKAVLARIVELFPVVTDVRKVTVTKEVIL